jgi:hypothetical protein
MIHADTLLAELEIVANPGKERSRFFIAIVIREFDRVPLLRRFGTVLCFRGVRLRDRSQSQSDKTRLSELSRGTQAKVPQQTRSSRSAFADVSRSGGGRKVSGGKTFPGGKTESFPARRETISAQGILRLGFFRPKGRHVTATYPMLGRDNFSHHRGICPTSQFVP